MNADFPADPLNITVNVKKRRKRGRYGEKYFMLFDKKFFLLSTGFVVLRGLWS
jgi:hypothetical protein